MGFGNGLRAEGSVIELVGEMPGEPDAILAASLGAWHRRLREEIEDG